MGNQNSKEIINEELHELGKKESSNSLDNINQNEAKNYLVENLFPHTLFGIIKKNWELLDA